MSLSAIVAKPDKNNSGEMGVEDPGNRSNEMQSRCIRCKLSGIKHSDWDQHMRKDGPCEARIISQFKATTTADVKVLHVDSKELYVDSKSGTLSLTDADGLPLDLAQEATLHCDQRIINHVPSTKTKVTQSELIISTNQMVVSLLPNQMRFIEIDVTTDPNHVGCIGVRCPPGQINVNGVCCFPNKVSDTTRMPLKSRYPPYIVRLQIHEELVVDEIFFAKTMDCKENRNFYVIRDLRQHYSLPKGFLCPNGYLTECLTGQCIQYHVYTKSWVLLGRYSLQTK